LGVTPAQQQLSARIRALDSSYKDSFSLTAGPRAVDAATKTFVFDRLKVSPALIAQRALCGGVAFLLVGLAAFFFDRFDAAPRVRGVRARPEAAPAAASAAPAAAHLTPVSMGRHSRFLGLYVAELKLLLRGPSRWWVLGAIGLLIAGLASPLEDARHQVLAFTWLWPVLLWSPLGNREART